MKDLIERLERATKWDRELGNDILLACGWTIDEQGDGPDRSLFWVSPDADYDCFNEGDQPDPTASLDAALTLVPEGWCSLMAWNPTGAICSISIKPLGHFDNAWPGDGKAPTPALALCIAALKARIAVERDLTESGE